MRGLLGRFLFSGDEVTKLLRDISGGEARRLSLALLVSSDSNLLVLDEPTNHLDVESREALEDALARFDGTMLLISHDRALLEAVGSRTVSLQDRHLRIASRRLGRVPRDGRGRVGGGEAGRPRSNAADGKGQSRRTRPRGRARTRRPGPSGSVARSSRPSRS